MPTPRSGEELDSGPGGAVQEEAGRDGEVRDDMADGLDRDDPFDASFGSGTTGSMTGDTGNAAGAGRWSAGGAAGTDRFDVAVSEGLQRDSGRLARVTLMRVADAG